MKAVLKREFKAYFYSPLGYVFTGAYFLFTGFFFYKYTLMANTTDMSEVFSTLFTVTLFLVPILTMRLVSEDRKTKTDQLLLMAPVSSSGIIIGKYLAAVLVYLIAISSTLVAAVALSFFAQPDWPAVIGHFAGLLLLGTAIVSIGLMVSSLTENQIIAAIGGFCASFFMMLLNVVATTVHNQIISGLLKNMSFETRYQPFTMGLLPFDGIVFFLSVSTFFVFVTICLFEKRRWA